MKPSKNKYVTAKIDVLFWPRWLTRISASLLGGYILVWLFASAAALNLFSGIVAMFAVIVLLADVVVSILGNSPCAMLAIFSKVRPEVANIISIVANGLAEYDSTSESFLSKTKDGKVEIGPCYLKINKGEGEGHWIELFCKEAYIVNRYLKAVERQIEKDKTQNALLLVNDASLEILELKEKETLCKIDELRKNIAKNNIEVSAEKSCVAPKTMLVS